MSFKIGDEVICVFPGNDNGPDCKVGNKFIILHFNHSVDCINGNDIGLVFSCHPYRGINGYVAIAARAWRFAKVKGLNEFTKEHTSEAVKIENTEKIK
jgi:hypothetical protein